MTEGEEGRQEAGDHEASRGSGIAFGRRSPHWPASSGHGGTIPNRSAATARIARIDQPPTSATPGQLERERVA